MWITQTLWCPSPITRSPPTLALSSAFGPAIDLTPPPPRPPLPPGHWGCGRVGYTPTEPGIPCQTTLPAAPAVTLTVTPQVYTIMGPDNPQELCFCNTDCDCTCANLTLADTDLERAMACHLAVERTLEPYTNLEEMHSATINGSIDRSFLAAECAPMVEAINTQCVSVMENLGVSLRPFYTPYMHLTHPQSPTTLHIPDTHLYTSLHIPLCHQQVPILCLAHTYTSLSTSNSLLRISCTHTYLPLTSQSHHLLISSTHPA